LDFAKIPAKVMQRGRLKSQGSPFLVETLHTKSLQINQKLIINHSMNGLFSSKSFNSNKIDAVTKISGNDGFSVERCLFYNLSHNICNLYAFHQFRVAYINFVAKRIRVKLDIYEIVFRYIYKSML